MATSSMNTLTVRRVDLLEQLQERYTYMTQEKAKYEKAEDKYRLACDKYEKDTEKWEARIPTLLEGMIRGSEIDHSHSSDYRKYRWADEHWDASVRVSITRDEVVKLIGPAPEKPEGPDRPDFLVSRRGRNYSENPSIYEAVYQAIAILSISNDEEVKAQMFNDILFAL